MKMPPSMCAVKHEAEVQIQKPKFGGGVSLFGIRFHLATDDFFVIFGLISVFQLLWLLFYGAVLGVYLKAVEDQAASFEIIRQNISHRSNIPTFDLDCFKENKLSYGSGILVGLLCLSLLNSILIVTQSRRGVIWEDRQGLNPRYWVAPLLHLAIILLLLELTAVVGTVVEIARAYKLGLCTVSGNSLLLAMIIGVLLHFLGVLMVVTAMWVFTKNKLFWEVLYKKSPMGDLLHDTTCSLLTNYWCRNSKGGHFRDVVELLSDTLFPDDRFVPTDVLAGLVLIYNYQAYKEFRLKELIAGQESSSLPQRNLPTFSDANPQDLVRFMLYAKAVYGYRMFLASDKSIFTSLRQLYQHTYSCKGFCCGHPFNRPDPDDFVVGDNCCMCDYAALRVSLPDLDDDDIIFASFVNQILETPFVVALDHFTCSVVIALRGTISFVDVLTDMVAKPTRMSDIIPSLDGFDESDISAFGDMCDYEFHTGMLKAAINVLEKIRKRNLIEKALAKAPDYKLVITGHSLGAGTATILAFLLKHRYPDLRCYTYGAPGGLLSLEATQKSQEFCTGVIIGSDIIPRTSIRAIHHLRKQMSNVLKESQLHKFTIIYQGVFGGRCSSKADRFEKLQSESLRRLDSSSGSDYESAEEEEEEIAYSSPFESESTDEESVWTDYLERDDISVAVTIDTSDTTAANYCPTCSRECKSVTFETTETSESHLSRVDLYQVKDMYTAGKILHFEGYKINQQTFDVSIREPTYFSHISVSHSMVRDHMPTMYIEILEKYAKDAN